MLKTFHSPDAGLYNLPSSKIHRSSLKSLQSDPHIFEHRACEYALYEILVPLRTVVPSGHRSSSIASL